VFLNDSYKIVSIHHGGVVQSANQAKLASYIDHTLLKPDATEADIKKVCSEAIEHSFRTVCINSHHLKTAAAQLKGTLVDPICVVGFPLGACATAAKAFETSWCIENGAKEIDMVINIGALKMRQLQFVADDIRAVVIAAQGRPVKVIIETALLSQEEKTLACLAALHAKAHFVKTCTGFSGGGATVADIKLMKGVVGNHLEVKASGGIKTKELALELIAAGATRLGTSSGISLISGTQIQGGY
jgi:deoxyribose-phosphate aldolase